MTTRFLLLTAAAASLVLGPACQRIPPSVSIPGYGEKQAEEKKEEAQAIGGTTNAPAFFPPAKQGE